MGMSLVFQIFGHKQINYKWSSDDAKEQFRNHKNVETQIVVTKFDVKNLIVTL